MSRYLPIALMFAFFIAGLNLYIASKPTSKAPIYNEIKKYSPYYFKKSLGGLEILSKEDKNFKEKPDTIDTYHRFEELQKEWGKKHLKIDRDYLVIESLNKIVKVPIKTKEDREFLNKFYGIK